jgi:hypothetical protein
MITLIGECTIFCTSRKDSILEPVQRWRATGAFKGCDRSSPTKTNGFFNQNRASSCEERDPVRSCDCASGSTWNTTEDLSRRLWNGLVDRSRWKDSYQHNGLRQTEPLITCADLTSHKHVCRAVITAAPHPSLNCSVRSRICLRFLFDRTSSQVINASGAHLGSSLIFMIAG